MHTELWDFQWNSTFLTSNWMDLEQIFNNSKNIPWNSLKFEPHLVTYYHYKQKQSLDNLDHWVEQGKGKILVMWPMSKVFQMGQKFRPEPQIVTRCCLQEVSVIGALEVPKLEGVFQSNLKILWKLWYWSNQYQTLGDIINVLGWPECVFSGQLHQWKVLGSEIGILGGGLWSSA